MNFLVAKGEVTSKGWSLLRGQHRIRVLAEGLVVREAGSVSSPEKRQQGIASTARDTEQSEYDRYCAEDENRGGVGVL